MSLLPNRNIFDGTLLPAVTTSGMQAALGTLRDFLATLLGTDSTNLPAARTALGAAAQGANADITSMTALASINGGSIAGLRNRIINGQMKIDQRNVGATQTITAAAALAYTIDQFYAYCTGANVTGQQVSVGALKRYKLTGATSVTAVGFGQRMEADSTMDMAGQTATFQVKLASSSLTSITWTAYYATTKDTFGSLASPTKTTIATGTFTINSTEATYNTQIAVPAGATTGVEIVLTGGALLSAQTLQIGDMQLEVGSVASAVEPRQIGNELTLCQRFFAKTFLQSVAPANNAGVAGALFASAVNGVSGYYGAEWKYPTTMRTAPSLASYNPFSGAAGNWQGFASSAVTSTGSGALGDSSCVVSFNGGGTFTPATADAWYVHVTAAAVL